MSTQPASTPTHAEQTIAYRIGDRLYLSITDRCTLVCDFCPKTLGSRRVHDYDLTLDHRPEFDEVVAAIGDPTDYAEVVFCGYGEPTLRLNLLLEVAGWIRARGGRVRLNTDGLGSLVNKRNILPEMAGLVDAVSVSLNAQSPEVYNRHCQPALPGAYQAVLAFLQEAPRYIPDVTATAIDGLEGVDIEACRRVARMCGARFRRRELDVVG
ncbi:MAG: TatD family nuclease-associated radical SAM protein [Gammaproteobacteria bacterium]|nr:TatD family nuclease-associated radical SAM protein [Gammaproteobacteria bacterium]